MKNSDDQKTAAGLGNLQATQTGNGDIVLAARAEYANAYDKAFNDLGKLAGLLGTTETPEINVPKTITASVENYGTIKTSTATGDVVLWKSGASEMLCSRQKPPTAIRTQPLVPAPLPRLWLTSKSRGMSRQRAR